MPKAKSRKSKPGARNAVARRDEVRSLGGAREGVRVPLGRQVWLDTARQALIEEGTAGIEVNKLAKRLGSSRGGFYWFFKSRAQLLDELLEYWVQTSTMQFDRLPNGGGTGIDQYLALTKLWIMEDEYDPAWDSAVRDWARTSEPVRKVVEEVDQKRIAVIEKIFQHMGYEGLHAHMRARVTYYHQVGYQAMGVRESRKRRLDLIPYYKEILTGKKG